MIRLPQYRGYLLAVLMTILAFNSLDRLALGLVLQDIKADLSLSDTQLGLLGGVAFTLFYSLAGIPIARWADRGNRVTIIAITTILWSVMVGLCGLATNFLQLLLIRVGVAVGEAGCTPPAFSLIADYFTHRERPRAVALYLLGGGVSVVIGYFVAGWLNQFYGWRLTFLVLGLPGLAPALLAWFTLREPRRSSVAMSFDTGASIIEERTRDETSITKVVATLWVNRTFRHLLLSFAVSAFFYSGVLQWQPAFFIRSYGLSTGELGTWLALIYGLGGVAGLYLGGEWATRWAANNERLQLWMMAIGYIVAGILNMFIYLSPNRYLAFGLMTLTTVISAAVNAPLFATMLALVPESMRATAISLVYLFANLIGVGLGPFLAGALSDWLYPWLGPESLRYTLLIMSPGYVLVGWQFWYASTTVTEDLATMQTAPGSFVNAVKPATGCT
jgi:MFS family permease